MESNLINAADMNTREAELEIRVIKKIMEDSRSAVYNKSSQGLLWFSLTAAAVLINYLMLVTGEGLQFTGLVWILVITAGTIFSIRISKKENREVKAKTFAGRILASIGISVGIANILFSFGSVAAFAYDPFIIVPLNSMVLGMAFFVIRVIQRLRSFLYITIVWWAGSLYFFFDPGINSLLFLGTMLLVSAWIPWREEKAANRSNRTDPSSVLPEKSFSGDSINAGDEISVIKKIIDDSKQDTLDNGWHYIYWGLIVTAALTANYLMVINNVSGNTQGLLWFISMISATIIEGLIEKKRSKTVKVKTFAGRLINTLWSASGICMFILGFAGSLSGAYNPVIIFPLISIVLGMTYFINGVIQHIKWFSLLSFLWWAGAILMLLFPGLHSMIIFSVMLICFQVIPGLVLFFRSKKVLNVLAV